MALLDPAAPTTHVRKPLAAEGLAHAREESSCLDSIITHKTVTASRGIAGGSSAGTAGTLAA
jgi:hypothetical protein